MNLKISRIQFSLVIALMVVLSTSCTQRRYSHMNFKHNLQNPFKKEKVLAKQNPELIDLGTEATTADKVDIPQNAKYILGELKAHPGLLKIIQRANRDINHPVEIQQLHGQLEAILDKKLDRASVRELTSNLNKLHTERELSPKNGEDQNDLSMQDLVYLILVVVLILLIIALFKSLLGPLWSVLVLVLLIVLLGMLLGWW